MSMSASSSLSGDQGAADARTSILQNLPDTPREIVRKRTWALSIFMALGIGMSVCVDILQYSMPLSFLPAEMEDQNIKTFDIAVAVGVYYWMGFAVTLTIACGQVWSVVTESPRAKPAALEVRRAKTIILYALTALSGGTVTLVIEALMPQYVVHVACRVVQGGCGGVIFVFCFLLASILFEGKQQVMSLTLVMVMFNVAEVVGPYFGAYVYSEYGMAAVYYCLAGVSLLCQIWLGIVMFFCIKGRAASVTLNLPLNTSGLPRRLGYKEGRGFKRLMELFAGRRFWVSSLLIFGAAAVKAGVEECFPFHAEHQWGSEPIQIGEFFSVVAAAYIVASAISSQAWEYLNCGAIRVILSAVMLLFLGCSSWLVFSLRLYSHDILHLRIALVFYGLFLGFTFTPATLLFGDAVENEEHGACKDAVNSLWNMVWEGGGSLGFVAGAFLAEGHAKQVNLMCGIALVCALLAVVIIGITFLPTTVAETLDDEECAKSVGITPAITPRPPGQLLSPLPPGSGRIPSCPGISSQEQTETEYERP